MKNYTITVNGTSYDVTVEEKGQSSSPVSAQTPAPAKPAPAPAASGSAGSIKVEAGAAGKVFKIVANVGDQVQKGDSVVILEAMKMEIPVVAPESGKVASIDVAVGDPVEAGKLLATLN